MTSINADANALQLHMAQLQDLAAQLPGSDNAKATSVPFAEHVNNALKETSRLQITAHDMGDKFVREDPSVSLSQVMVQMQKAEVSLSALVAVRNKVVDGYKAVMNMSL